MSKDKQKYPPLENNTFVLLAKKEMVERLCESNPPYLDYIPEYQLTMRYDRHGQMKILAAPINGKEHAMFIDVDSCFSDEGKYGFYVKYVPFSDEKFACADLNPIDTKRVPDGKEMELTQEEMVSALRANNPPYFDCKEYGYQFLWHDRFNYVIATPLSGESVGIIPQLDLCFRGGKLNLTASYLYCRHGQERKKNNITSLPSESEIQQGRVQEHNDGD